MTYLKKNLNNDSLTSEYINLFYDYLNFYKNTSTPSTDSGVSIDSTSILQIAKICNQLNKEHLQSERLIVFMQLLELIDADDKVAEKEEEFLSLVALNFNLNQEDVKYLKSFILHADLREVSKNRLLLIDNKQTEWPEATP